MIAAAVLVVGIAAIFAGAHGALIALAAMLVVWIMVKVMWATLVVWAGLLMWFKKKQ